MVFAGHCGGRGPRRGYRKGRRERLWVGQWSSGVPEYQMGRERSASAFGPPPQRRGLSEDLLQLPKIPPFEGGAASARPGGVSLSPYMHVSFIRQPHLLALLDAEGFVELRDVGERTDHSPLGRRMDVT